MQKYQKILFVSAIVVLAMIALVEGVLLLRNSPHWQDWTVAASKTFRNLIQSPKSQTADAPAENEDLVLQETAEDLDQIHNQINHLFYEMSRNAAFPQRSFRAFNPANDPRVPFENTRPGVASLAELGQASEAWVSRLQSEIGQIFRMAHENRHSRALSLIEQDWRDVGQISLINMEPEETNYVVTVSMPGFEKSDINISLTDRILTIEAGTEQRDAARDSQTFSAGRFKTQIMLPNDITGDSAQAFFKDGILQIMVPRIPATNSLARRIIIR